MAYEAMFATLYTNDNLTKKYASSRKDHTIACHTNPSHDTNYNGKQKH
jgi:hypothetical protein